MATYAEMFGGSDKDFLRIQKEDEKVEAIFLDFDKTPQRGDDGKPQFMVRVTEDGPWGPKSKGSFNPDEVETAFPLMQLELKLEVNGKVMYHTLSKTAEDAFKAAMKRSEGIEEGDTIGIWLVSTAKKPYTWKYQIVRQEG
jgi:hypothetical protein